MTLGRFVWKNAIRNKRRASLTILSIGFSLFLLMSLLTFLDLLLHPQIEDDSALRLMTIRSTSLADMMPISYLDKIKRIPHVRYVIPLQWFNGTYKDPNYQFANFATDPNLAFDVFTEHKITPEHKAAFASERTGAVAGMDLVKRFGWKIGDRFTLIGTIFPIDLELKLVGTFTAANNQNMLFFRYDYFKEAMGDFNEVGAFSIRATDAASIPAIADAVDGMFRNSPAETKTDTEKAFVLGFISMLGNIQVIIGSVAGVVVFTMLLVVVSTMAMSVRERLREVAILKTLGFPRRLILSLVIAEAMLISLVGTCIGIGLGESLRFVDMDRITQGFIPKFNPTFPTYATVIGAGIAIGFISGLLPAWQAAKMTITGAMRQVE